MIPQLIISFVAEGPTDYRFLESIIQKTFEEVAFECEGQIEVLPVILFEKIKGDFITQVHNHALRAFEIGCTVLCIHTDADAENDSTAFNNKIIPAFEFVKDTENSRLCKNLVAVVPVHMTEAWMLADKELLKAEIGTQKSDNELGINRHPESIPNPKLAIEEAIRRGRSDLNKKRRAELSISELYQIIGSSVSIDKLKDLPSYIKFKNSVQKVFRDLNYLH